MFRNAPNSNLATLTSMGKGISGHFTKNHFDGRCMKCPDLHTKLHVCQPVTLQMGRMGVSLLKHLLLGITSNIKHWIENPCLAIPTAHVVGVRASLLKCFARYCIKCSELYKKSQACHSCTLVGWGQFLNQSVFARIEWNIQIYIE